MPFSSIVFSVFSPGTVTSGVCSVQDPADRPLDDPAWPRGIKTIAGFTYQKCVLALLIAWRKERRKHWERSPAPSLTSPGASARLCFFFSNRKVTNEIVWGYKGSMSKPFLFPSSVVSSHIELELPTSSKCVHILIRKKNTYCTCGQVKHLLSELPLREDFRINQPPAFFLLWLLLIWLQFWIL